MLHNTMLAAREAGLTMARLQARIPPLVCVYLTCPYSLSLPFLPRLCLPFPALK